MPVDIDEIAGHPLAEDVHVAPGAAQVEAAVSEGRPVAVFQVGQGPAFPGGHEFALGARPQPPHPEFMLQKTVHCVQRPAWLISRQVEPAVQCAYDDLLDLAWAEIQGRGPTFDL